LKRLSFSSARLDSLANQIDIKACEKFFNMCADLKRYPHPLLGLRPAEFPAYYLPADHPEIDWGALTLQQRNAIRRHNFLDFDEVCEVARTSPTALVKPSHRLNKLEQKEAEQGYLSTSQQVSRVAYKARKAWSAFITGQKEFTKFDFELLRACTLVQPMYSGNGLHWPDGETISIPSWRR
jgi:hypothetical protein